MFTTQSTNSTDAGPDLLYRLHPVQNTEQQRITRNAPDTEMRFGHAGRQPARADDFEPILEEINLHIGSRAIITMGQSVDHYLTNGPFRQFRPFLPFDMPDDVFHLDPGKNPGHHIINHGIDIAVETAPVQDAHLIGARKKSTCHVGTGTELADVTSQ